MYSIPMTVGLLIALCVRKLFSRRHKWLLIFWYTLLSVWITTLGFRALADGQPYGIALLCGLQDLLSSEAACPRARAVSTEDSADGGGGGAWCPWRRHHAPESPGRACGPLAPRHVIQVMVPAAHLLRSLFTCRLRTYHSAARNPPAG